MGTELMPWARPSCERCAQKAMVKVVEDPLYFDNPRVILVCFSCLRWTCLYGSGTWELL